MSEPTMFRTQVFGRSRELLLLLAFGASTLPMTPISGQLAFVTDATSNLLQVVDAGRIPPEVIETHSVGTGPVGVAFSSGGDRVFLTNSQDGTLSIVDRTDSSVTSLPMGTSPSGVAISPAGDRLYVTDFDEGRLRVVDLVAEPPEVLTSTPLGTKPDGIVVSADGTRLFVADAEDGASAESLLFLLDATVSPPLVIDMATVPPEPHGIALGPDGTVYLPSSDDNLVSFFDPETLDSLGSVAVPGRPYSVVVDPTGSRLYVSLVDIESLAVVDLTGMPPAVVDEPSVGSGAFGVDVDASGALVFVPATFTGELVIFDASSLPLTELTTLDVGGTPVSFGSFVFDSGSVFRDGFESGDTAAWSLVMP